MELFSETQSGCEAGIYQPLLAYLSSKKSGGPPSSFKPQFQPLPLTKLAKLALLYREAGFEEEAGKLCDLLDRIEKFPTLWCPEFEFQEKKFRELYQKLSSIPRIAHIDPIDLSLLNQHGVSLAITLSGNGTSMGAVRANHFDVQAFGPQSKSLKFGIRGSSMDGWTQTFSHKEVWLKLNHGFIENNLQLNFHFVGIQQEDPLYIAFYVKSQSCFVEGEPLLPKSLKRFKGQTKKIVFKGQSEIEVSTPLHTEVIPLSGDDCFWGSDFLLLFEMNHLISQVSFKFICH